MSLMLSRRTKLGAGAAAALVSDAFNRADNTTTLGNADTGQAWTPWAGTWGIETNRAYSVGTTPADRQVFLDSGQSDVTVEADVVVHDVTAGAGVLFRGVDANNYWMFVAEPDTPRWALYKREGGAHTVVAALNQALTTGRMAVVASGSSIICKLDGTTLFSATDTTHQTATRHGFRIYKSGAESPYRFDNFKVTV